MMTRSAAMFVFQVRRDFIPASSIYHRFCATVGIFIPFWSRLMIVDIFHSVWYVSIFYLL